MQNIIIVICIALGIAILIAIIPKSENYGFVTGRLGRYYDGYNQCLSNCEREDPGKFLAPTKGSLYCAQYCDSKYTDLARMGGPSYPKDPTILGLTHGDGENERRVDSCHTACAPGDAGRECRHSCNCEDEVNQKCRLDCAYSKLSEGSCMELCRKKIGVNCSSVSWSWK